MPLADDDPDELEGIFKLLTFEFVAAVVVVVPDAAVVVAVAEVDVVAADVDADESELTTSPESNIVN